MREPSETDGQGEIGTCFVEWWVGDGFGVSGASEFVRREFGVCVVSFRVLCWCQHSAAFKSREKIIRCFCSAFACFVSVLTTFKSR